MTKISWTAMVAVGLMTLSACSKDDDNNGSTTSTTIGTGDGDGDAETSTTTDPGDGDGDATTTTTTTTAGFVPEDVAAQNTCDPWAQDCPEGEKCAAWNSGSGTWDANKCVPLTGTGQEGDDCTYDGAALGTDTCDVGFMCYYTDAEGLGSCIPLCTGDPDNGQCPAGYNCSISNDGSLLLCVYSCDPLLQDCSEGNGCFWDGAFFNCDPAGDIPTNEPCGFINDCLPGHVCLGSESLPSCAGSACCAGFCDLSQPNCTVADTECIAFFEEGTAPPGLENTGVCALPGA